VCGICGSTATDSVAAVRDMNRAQIHRGPDDEGTYEDPRRRISLGARRLSIIDLAGGHQPVSNEDGTIWAVLNGEIYNSPALQDRLRKRGHRFRSHTDTETLVHLYEEYGDDLPHALDGMFAFAVWDEQRGRLLLARDRFGEKPLFVERGGRGLAFASELSALVGARQRTPDLDREAVDAFLVLGYVPGPGTIVQGIHQLPPGTTLIWDAAEDVISTRAYWSASRPVGGGNGAETETTAEALRLLERAVADTLVSDVPVGIFLSGGLDSTLIAALITAQMREPIHTFTVGYNVGEVSELSAARDTADRLGTLHHELVIDAADVCERAHKVLRALDQPLADPALIPLHAVSELARRHVTVAVGGEGADELFGGYPRYRWMVRSAQISRRLSPRYAALGARALSFRALPHSAQRFADIIAPQATAERNLDWVTAGRRHIRPALYGPAMSALANSDSVLKSAARHVDEFNDEPDAAAFMQLDQRQWLPDDVLFKSDRAGMLNSLEVRAPYLSRQLAEFANSVSAASHVSDPGKTLLRAALSSRFPQHAGRRRKTAFRIPGEQWLRGPLMPLLNDQIAHGTLVSEGFVNRDFVRATMSEHAGGQDCTSLLWPLMSLGLWLDRYSGRPEY
jgi:asparagine synthase (glutamine-hydrolysing)